MSIANQTAIAAPVKNKRLGAELFSPRFVSIDDRAPVPVVLEPDAGATAVLPAVRIFVASESAHFRAERVFVWALRQVRNPARRYEIYLLKDLAGFDRMARVAPLDQYANALFALAGGQGRAIFNQVNQVYLKDPGLLFDVALAEKEGLRLSATDASVLLLDCDRLASRTGAQAMATNLSQMPDQVMSQVNWGPLPQAWNTQDPAEITEDLGLLSYQAAHQQPWQPFPKRFHYEAHPQAALWQRLEAAADQAGFFLFTEEKPSRRYQELLNMYATLHDEGAAHNEFKAKKTFPGSSLAPHVKPIARLLAENGVQSLLDYGSGKGTLYLSAAGHPEGSRFKRLDQWGNVLVTCYDPGYAPYAGPIEDHYDCVITTDVLEHIPEEDIGWILDKLFAHARKCVYLVAACYPAKKHLPDGTNAHCTLQSPEWWEGQLRLVARRYPSLRWVLCTQERSWWSFGQREKLTRKGIRTHYFNGN